MQSSNKYPTPFSPTQLPLSLSLSPRDFIYNPLLLSLYSLILSPYYNYQARMTRGKRFSRCLRAPIRALTWARDMYVRSLNECAGQMPYEAAIGYPSFGATGRSYSLRSDWSGSTDEDMAELIRAATEKRVGAVKTGPADLVQRSQSVAIGRIDEDTPVEFRDSDFKMGSSLFFPRSRSYTAARTNRIGAKSRVSAFA